MEKCAACILRLDVPEEECSRFLRSYGLYNIHIPKDQNIRFQVSKFVSPLGEKSSTVE